MIEIWTEDSTSGYQFISNINRIMFGSKYKVIKHNGNGQDRITKECIYGGLLLHLKQFKGNNAVMIIADNMTDKEETEEIYETILDEIRLHDNIFMIKQECFEINVLSYKHINELTGNTDIRLNRLADELVQLTSTHRYTPENFSTYLIEYLKNFSIDHMHGEFVSKSLLAEITNVPVRTRSKTFAPSLISKSNLGPCWAKDCCVLSDDKYRRCKLDRPYSINEKMVDVINNSLFYSIALQLNNYTKLYMESHYKITNNKEEYFKNICDSNIDENILDKYIIQMIEQFNCWNYEKIANKYLRTKR